MVDDFPELDGQVFGKVGGFLAGEDQVQVISFEQWAMGIMGAAGEHGEASVEIFTELRQVSVGRLDS